MTLQFESLLVNFIELAATLTMASSSAPSLTTEHVGNISAKTLVRNYKSKIVNFCIIFYVGFCRNIKVYTVQNKGVNYYILYEQCTYIIQQGAP